MISIALVIYLLVGPFAWLALFVSVVMGRLRMGRLARWSGQLPADPPEVTILIPAKDEAAGIAQCLDAVLAQDYPRFNVVAIDDRSTDRTGGILDQIASRDRRVRVIHVTPGDLPAGWLGKCHALHLGQQQARGQWLLFVDSDVTLSPGALRAALSLALARNYDAVSILPKLQCRSFLERLMLPLLAAAWAIMHAISRTNQDNRTGSAAANGQFFLIRRSAYQAVGGHQAVRDQITEDVELMRLLKSRGFRTRFFTGSHLASTRMHARFGQMLHGWARIYCGSSRWRPWRMLGAMLFVLTALFSAYPAVAWGLYNLAVGGEVLWIAAAAAHLVLMTIWLAMIYRWSGNQARYTVLAPLAGAIMLAIFSFSLHKCRTGRIDWRGTQVAT